MPLQLSLNTLYAQYDNFLLFRIIFQLLISIQFAVCLLFSTDVFKADQHNKYYIILTFSNIQTLSDAPAADKFWKTLLQKG